MQKNITSRSKTWRIQFPVLDKVWTENIAGDTLEQALTDLWGIRFPNFKKNNLSWVVLFQYKDTIWAKIRNTEGEFTEQYKHEHRIIKILSGELGDLKIRKRLNFWDKNSYERFLSDMTSVENVK